MRFCGSSDRERGSIPVLVALCLTGLIGFISLAVDFGMMASTRQSMQNAVDAAALAAAGDLACGNSSRASTTAEEYCRVNGFDPGQARITMDVQTTWKTVTVTLRKDLPMAFSALLTGEKDRSVSATATAEAVSVFGSFNYAMFAAQRIEDSGYGINMQGNDIVIQGNIHSNSDIFMHCAVLYPGAVATAVRNIYPNSTGWYGNSLALDMPSVSAFEKAMSRVSHLITIPGDVVKEGTDGIQELVDEAVDQYAARGIGESSLRSRGIFIHITGSLTLNGYNEGAHHSDYPMTLMVDGSITLNGAPMTSSADNPLCLMSKYGNIVVNGGSVYLVGILFAPNGNIIINGNDAVFMGRVIAQNIQKYGGKTTIIYREDTDRYLPKTKVHLIA